MKKKRMAMIWTVLTVLLLTACSQSKYTETVGSYYIMNITFSRQIMSHVKREKSDTAGKNEYIYEDDSGKATMTLAGPYDTFEEIKSSYNTNNGTAIGTKGGYESTGGEYSFVYPVNVKTEDKETVVCAKFRGSKPAVEKMVNNTEIYLTGVEGGKTK